MNDEGACFELMPSLDMHPGFLYAESHLLRSLCQLLSPADWSGSRHILESAYHEHATLVMFRAVESSPL